MPHIIAKSVFAAFIIYAASSVAADVQINVTKDDCKRVEKHIANDDVAYKPGVDVRGNPVTPADLTENKLTLPENIIIDLSLPIKDLFKDKNPRLENAEVQVGVLDYNLASGKLKFNGQELNDPALHAIAVKCKEIYADKDS
ncbi:MAG: hypothetical protein JKY12_00955 [Sneathiella sp.]|nr:hypothetical protein [Sneathiella sp.]